MTEALTHNPVVSPALMPQTRKASDPAKRRGREFALGERNPKTLPGAHSDSESVDLNRARTRYWRQVGKLVQAGRFIGSKY